MRRPSDPPAGLGGGGVPPYYQDEYVTIYHGDARDVIADLGPVSVDLLLTDPPYGMSYVSGRRANAANVSADGVRQGMRITRQVIAEAMPRLATDAHLLVFCHWQSWPDFYDALAPYADIKNALIWWKARGGMGDVAVEYAPDYEVILYAARGRREIFGAGAHGARRKRVGAVLAGYPPVGSNRSHPTEKPVGLMRDLVERHTPADGVVLDPFMGTGATIVAARSIGRRAIGIEIEEAYCEIAAERLSQGVLDLAVAGGAQ